MRSLLTLFLSFSLLAIPAVILAVPDSPPAPDKAPTPSKDDGKNSSKAENEKTAPPEAPMYQGDANQIATTTVQDGNYVYAVLKEGIFVRITCQQPRYAVNTDKTIWRLEFGKGYLLPIRGQWSILASLD